MKMTILKSFLICTFKDTNLAKKLSNLAENQKKKLNSTEFMEFVFFKSGLRSTGLPRLVSRNFNIIGKNDWSMNSGQQRAGHD